ncbi:MAG TPA: IclR family transcriptional regulator, partial [Salinarimonas sp.]|nr:IclR family transcriptional regulator [Salinarimonas sp.]
MDVRARVQRRVDDAALPDAPAHPDGPEDADRNFVTALARGLEVLRAFDSARLLGNGEIAARTGLPKATVSRLTYTLTRLGYLQHDPVRQAYRLDPRVLGFGFAALTDLGVRDIAHPLMERLARESCLSCGLGLRDRLSVMYIDVVDGGGAITLRVSVGSRLPLATSAMGRALLAGLPDAERAHLLGMILDREPDAARRAEIADGVAQAGEAIARSGFCAAIGEWQVDVAGIGVPLVTPAGAFALNLGGPLYRVDRDRLVADYAPRLVEIARHVRDRL